MPKLALGAKGLFAVAYVSIASSAGATELKETPACGNGAAEVARLEVRASNFVRIINGEETKVTLLEEQGCLRIGGSLFVDSVLRALPSRTIIFREPGPEVTVVKISGIPLEQLSEKSSAYVRGKLKLSASTLKSPLIVFLTIQKKKGISWKPTKNLPEQHPLARSWSPTGAVKVPEDFIVVDVRGNAELKNKKNHNVVRLEVGPAKARFSPLRPVDLKFDKLRFLESVRGRTILVVGENSEDFRSYNLVSALALEGGLDVRYFRDGWAKLWPE